MQAWKFDLEYPLLIPLEGLKSLENELIGCGENVSKPDSEVFPIPRGIKPRSVYMSPVYSIFHIELTVNN